MKNKEGSDQGLLHTLRHHNAWKVSPERLHLFGVPIDRVDRTEALQAADAWIRTKSPTRVIFTPDTTAVMRAKWDKSLRDAYQSANLVTADGTGLLWASRMFGTPLKERVTGIDLLQDICSIAERREKRIYLLGAKPGVAKEAANALLTEHPNLKICGIHHGYFAQNESASVIEQIQKAAPDLLFVAMGVPLQERWIMEHREALGVAVVMGVGGSFDVIAGQVKRAPLSWQNSGFEWLWRTLQEPWRWKRLKVIPTFLIQLIFYRVLGWMFNSI